METYKIVIHNPDIVDMQQDELNKRSTMYEEYKEFKSRSEAKQWLSDYVEIIQMIG